VNPSWVKPFSRESIRAVVKFLPILESIGPEDLARIVKPPALKEDGFVVGHLEYHQAVHEFMRACYDNELVQPFDWPAWARQGRRYMSDPAFVASARLETCIKLIMASVRYERFCDGHLGEVIKSGHIAAILRRLETIGGCTPGNYTQPPRRGG
jgi:ADP-ribosyl-[dinitrogen reductase] hydrolase